VTKTDVADWVYGQLIREGL